MKKPFALLALLLSLASAAFAQAPGTMSYQGVLTDNSGSIVADGNYALVFRIYDVAAGGLPLWTESHPAVPVQRGGFGLTLGLASPLALGFDKKYFLGVQVGADPELAPRVELTSSPYSLSLRLPFSQTISSSSPLLTLRNTGTGAAMQANGRLEVGSNAVSGELQLLRAGAPSPVVRAATGLHGGSVYLRDEIGSINGFLDSDIDGEGGHLAVYRTFLNQGFAVDANRSGTNEPRVAITGSSQSAVFDFTMTGDDAVALPGDAISALEQVDEPGVAAATNTGFVTLDGTTQTVLSRTITSPAPGYVLAIATGEAFVVHTNGGLSNADIGVSTSAGVLPLNQDVDLLLPTTLPSGSYRIPVTVHGLFEVAAGATTVHFIGDEASGDWSLSDLQLTLVYLPTAYGTVTPTEPALRFDGDQDAATPARPVTAGETLAEQAEALRFQQARLERELGQMRGRFERLQREMAETAARQASAADADGRK